ncbi:MAG: transporter substrate-binding domain-containing protein [Pseudomonadota bacterium]
MDDVWNWKKSSRQMLASFSLAIAVLASQSAQAEGIVEKIRSNGQFNVATEAAYEPYEFIEDGQITGYSKQILDYVVADLGVELNQLDLPFQGILPGLIAGKYDFVATSVSINEKRAARYAYTRPVGTNQNIILVREADERINEPKDLAGMVVATQLASSMEPVATEHSKSLETAGGEGYSDLKLFQAIPETIVALASSQVDAVIVGSVQAAVAIKRRPGTFRIAAELGNPRYLAWVARTEDKDLRDYMNVKIGELVDSGKIAEWQNEWFGFEMDMPSSGYLPEGAQ